MLLLSLLPLCFLVKVSSAPVDINEDKQRLQHLQKKTDDLLTRLKNYEIMIPHMVDKDGNFLSYNVKHRVHKRWKREISGKKMRLFYKLSAFGKDYNFALNYNSRLLSEGYFVEFWGNNGQKRRSESNSNCHYTGYSTQPFNATAAFSNCFGLHGILHTGEDDIFVEPLWNHTNTQQTNGHPHVVYRTSDIIVIEDDIQCGLQSFNQLESFADQIDKDDKFDVRKHKNIKRNSFHRLNNRIFAYDRPRHKRSEHSDEVNVETMVVADKRMVEYHGSHVIESYMLSIMNIVARLFHDGSIGNAVNIVVTRLIILEQDQKNLSLNHHAGESLHSFCQWQNLQNLTADGTGTSHHDNAVLITGYDICTYKNEPCGTLGLATVGGMCDHDRSCNINADIGLASAYTVAHEIGHNFGMQHDGAKNLCGRRSDKPAGIMTAQLTKNSHPYSWSSCSREYITEFLDSGKGSCLMNQPSEELIVRPQQTDLPSNISTANEQCKVQFDERSTMCKPQVVCQELWCYNTEGKCKTKNIPAVDGTECLLLNTDSGWCYRGKCRPLDYQPEPLNGEWGEWSVWSECTRSCGGGVESSKRKCNNPEPRDGGKYCLGKRKRYRSCNLDLCPENTTDFRELQCADSNDKPFKGKLFNWKPFSGAQDRPCALNCIAVGYNFYTERARKVIDGTRCYPDKRDMCINGKCLPVGCDGILESSAIEDKCRVCNGNGTSCQTVSGIFDQDLPKGAYHEVVVIPRGAVHILVREIRSSKNFLALKSNATGEYYINGEWSIDWPRKFSIGGTVFDYQRIDNRPESLQAIGPTTEDLVVMILIQEDNLGIEYEYNIPKRLSPTNHDVSLYMWQHLPWSQCSHSCGTGRRVSRAVCINKLDHSVVENHQCAPQPKPSNQITECNTEPCPAVWSTGTWSQCSVTCGRGRKTRNVICVQTLTQLERIILPGEECPRRKPISVRRCRKTDCPSSWYFDDWSECSSRCGRGRQMRNVYCMTSDKKRHLSDDNCDIRLRPLSKKACMKTQCPNPQWITENWGQCSSSCGRGQQERRVFCRAYNGHSSIECNVSTKPATVQECETTCRISNNSEDCIDQEKVQFCPLVVKFGYCRREYFHRICCSSCSTDRHGAL